MTKKLNTYRDKIKNKYFLISSCIFIFISWLLIIASFERKEWSELNVFLTFVVLFFFILLIPVKYIFSKTQSIQWYSLASALLLLSTFVWIYGMLSGFLPAFNTLYSFSLVYALSILSLCFSFFNENYFKVKTRNYLMEKLFCVYILFLFLFPNIYYVFTKSTFLIKFYEY